MARRVPQACPPLRARSKSAQTESGARSRQPTHATTFKLFPPAQANTSLTCSNSKTWQRQSTANRPRTTQARPRWLVARASSPARCTTSGRAALREVPTLPMLKEEEIRPAALAELHFSTMSTATTRSERPDGKTVIPERRRFEVI